MCTIGHSRLIVRLVHRTHLLYTARPMRGTSRISALRTGSRRFSISRLLLALAFAIVAHPVLAKKDIHGDEPSEFPFDEKYAEKWKESAIVLPPYPDDHDLLPVAMGSTDTLKIYIDGKSISRAQDRVARFALIVESPSGARSVFYDGYRCETRQYKTYAIGTPQHAWTTIANPQWQAVPRSEINAFRDNIYRHYVCDENKSARAPEDLRRLLKNQP
jgi:hypothetical protein